MSGLGSAETSAADRGLPHVSGNVALTSCLSFLFRRRNMEKRKGVVKRVYDSPKLQPCLIQHILIILSLFLTRRLFRRTTHESTDKGKLNSGKILIVPGKKESSFTSNPPPQNLMNMLWTFL